MLCLLLLFAFAAAPLRVAAQSTAPFVWLKSYSGVYSYTRTDTEYALYSDGSLWYGYTNINVITNILDWSRTVGGTNTSVQTWTNRYLCGDYSYSFDQTVSDTTVFPPWPEPGTRTAFQIQSASDVPEPNPANSSVTTTNVPNSDAYPGYHLSGQYQSSWSTDPPDPFYQLSGTENRTDAYDDQIELWTGGEPGSSNAVTITLYVVAADMDTGLYIDPSEITLLGMTPDTNGLVTITNNANAFVGCTPSVAATHSNYWFSVGVVCVAGPPMTITMGTNPNDVSGQTTEVIVGQPINLVASLDGGIITNVIWTLPPANIIFADCITNAQQGKVVDFTNINSANILFYFKDNIGSPFTAQCSVSGTINGVATNLTRSVRFAVFRPAGLITIDYTGLVKTDTNYVALPALTGKPVLGFGGRYVGTNIVPGMDMFGTNLNSAGYQGDWFFAQVIPESILRAMNTNGAGLKKTLNGLDGPFVYSRNMVQAANGFVLYGNDSPARELTTPYFNKFRRQDWFDLYLMFQPAMSNSKPVSIQKLTWGWWGASKRPGADWEADLAVPNSFRPATSSIRWSSHPTWSTNINDNLGTWIAIPPF